MTNFNDQLHEDLYIKFVNEFLGTGSVYDLFPQESAPEQHERWIEFDDQDTVIQQLKKQLERQDKVDINTIDSMDRDIANLKKQLEESNFQLTCAQKVGIGYGDTIDKLKKQLEDLKDYYETFPHVKAAAIAHYKLQDKDDEITHLKALLSQAVPWVETCNNYVWQFSKVDQWLKQVSEVVK